MPRLNDPGFWQPYLPQLRREFSELTMDILLAGGDAGADSIRAASVLVDWDEFNSDALRWLDMYLGGGPVAGLTQEGAYAWAWALNEATRRGVAKEIDAWVRAGAPLPELERRLGHFFDEKRARRIAATEVTRIYASGNVMAWKASGVVSGKRWQTARDELVCPICGKLHNTLVELDRGWEFSAAALAADPALARALRAPVTVVVPPAHVGCRCWLQPVVFEAMTPEEIAAGRFDPLPVGGARSGGTGFSPVGIAPSSGSPRPARPTGTAVSGAIAVPKSGKAAPAMRKAIDLIDRVHGDGNLPAIKMTVKALKRQVYGRYWSGVEKGMVAQGIDLARTTPADHIAATIVHEVGHFLDHKGIPSPDFATTDSETDELMSGWRDAIRNSRAVQGLLERFDSPGRYRVSFGGYSAEPNKGYIYYLLKREELWARSYTQYIATRSGDAELLAAIADARNDPMHGEAQWDDDDFEPIGAAMDALFKVLGWLS